MYTATGYSNDVNSERPVSVGHAIPTHLRNTHFLVVFREAHKPAKAMIAYEKSLDWRELFEIAIQESVSPEDLGDTAYRLAGKSLLIVRDIVLI